jgi:toxin YoeB
MPRKIVWTSKAISDLENIFDYWNNRNKSNLYSRKLNKLIRASLALVAAQPLIGLVTDMKDIRIKMVRDYWIFYKEKDNQIFVLQIMSSHQDPQSYFVDL